MSSQNIHYFYVHQLQSTIPIVVYPLAILAARPECCALNLTLNYTGNSTRHWLYSSLTDPHLIASCNTCFKKRNKMYFDEKLLHNNINSKCGRCCDFDFMTQSKVCRYKPPPNYPTAKYPTSPPLPAGRDVYCGRSNTTEGSKDLI